MNLEIPFLNYLSDYALLRYANLRNVRSFLSTIKVSIRVH